MNLTLTIKNRAGYMTEHDWTHSSKASVSGYLAAGLAVEYRGHIPGGMVKAAYAGEIIVLHPASTVELSIGGCL